MNPLIRFCEEKYVYSEYIAEFYNTTSNISYILAGIMVGYNGGNVSMIKNLFLIGIGSALFHGFGTILTEMIDEIWILLTICDIIILMDGKDFYDISMFVYFFGIFLKEFNVFYTYLGLLTIFSIYLIFKKYGACRRFINIIFFIITGKICWYMEHHFFYCELHSLWHILSAISLYHVGMLE